ncbi:exopolysaccharide biosynthesis polyprenyl glycosylphosphotransferase [Microvirga roseola]|uniref:exopolysaccharide biosynthesis polyprenyl glycosylphosphotransferase n=1 Tax=Microvirga roseola TaxID=2883126 RepID=UPI0022A8C0E6|nr:exopolysaccharide biosynthesis polyprenyl glycosylphosphotransferase [Microvirga roseola]
MESRVENLSARGAAPRRTSSRSSRASSRPEMVKRALDLTVALLALFFLLPLFLAVAFAIKIDSRGPIFFWQTRRGLNGRPFRILKFRTMTVLEDGGVIEQAKRGDARVTRLGKELRRTSIDELPQLVNVIRGEMSLVGPRPHALAHDEYYGQLIENYSARHSVKPGITGWAQVNGARGETPEVADMRRRVELDLWYADNWTVGLDLRIIATTAIQVVRNPDAF